MLIQLKKHSFDLNIRNGTKPGSPVGPVLDRVDCYEPGCDPELDQLGKTNLDVLRVLKGTLSEKTRYSWSPECSIPEAQDAFRRAARTEGQAARDLGAASAGFLGASVSFGAVGGALMANSRHFLLGHLGASLVTAGLIGAAFSIGVLREAAGSWSAARALNGAANSLEQFRSEAQGL